MKKLWNVKSSLIGATVLLSIIGANSLTAEMALAAIIINAVETRSSVRFFYQGSVNLDGLTRETGTSQFGFIIPSTGLLGLGKGEFDFYSNAYSSKPSNYGIGANASSFFNFGDPFRLSADGFGVNSLFVPRDYVSGTQISGRSLFSGNFASLGIDNSNNSYVWTLVSGDTVTLQIAPAQIVPEPLTMMGASTAIVFSAFFKRKLQSKKENN